MLLPAQGLFGQLTTEIVTGQLAMSPAVHSGRNTLVLVGHEPCCIA